MPSALRCASLLGARSGSRNGTRTIHHHPILPMDPAAPIRPSLLLRPHPKQKGRSTGITLLTAVSPLKTHASRTLSLVARFAHLSTRVCERRTAAGLHDPTLSGCVSMLNLTPVAPALHDPTLSGCVGLHHPMPVARALHHQKLSGCVRMLNLTPVARALHHPALSGCVGLHHPTPVARALPHPSRVATPLFALDSHCLLYTSDAADE